MKKLACEMCGSTNIVKEEGLYNCRSCGTKYSSEEAKKMMVEGTVKVDTSSEAENFKKLAKRYQDNGNLKKAGEYYDKLLELNPDDYDAVFYKGIIGAMKSNFTNYNYDLYDGFIELVSAYRNVMNILDSKDLDKNDEIKVKLARESHNLISSILDTFQSYETFNIEGYPGQYIPISDILGNLIIEMCNHDYEIYCILVSEVSEKRTNVKEVKLEILKSNVEWLSFISNKCPTFNISEMYDNRVNDIKKLEPDYNPPELKTSESGGCYIATSVYGAYDCPEVWTLRRFRDDNLLKKWYGRLFVKIYYTFSPTLVKYFGDKELFKKLFKSRLDKLIKKLHENGVESTYYIDK